MKYKFVQFKKNGSWFLEINDFQTLISYFKDNHSFENDKNHYIKLKNSNNSSATLVSHSTYGFFINMAEKAGNSIDDAYNQLRLLQITNMAKALDEKKRIFVNKNDGFCFTQPCEFDSPHFVYRDSLSFPVYFSNDIRIKRFDDGVHYYAYVGDTQVRNGNIIKWNTYEEALKEAESYIKKRRKDANIH